jgi:hypothetical protein
MVINSIRANSRPAVGAAVRFCLLLIFAACMPHLVRAAAVDWPASSAVSTGLGLPFAIADLDGDNRPDFASVQSSRGATSSTDNYWVHLRLSASGKRYIRFAAPKGGLLIEARDVNGDNAVDLVFATAWLGRPVAILLNDGHGNFSQADPSAFPRAFTQPKSGWGSAAVRFSDVPGSPQESPTGYFRLAIVLKNLQPQKDSLRLPGPELLPRSFLTLRAGRAPPIAILL